MHKPLALVKFVSKKDHSLKIMEGRLDQFIATIKEKKCHAFFAVAITDDDGSVVHDAAYNSGIMAYALSGAVEIAKGEFLKSFNHDD